MADVPANLIERWCPMSVAVGCPPASVLSTVHEGIDWARVTMPPCVERIRARIDSEHRYANIIRAYYAPIVTAPDDRRADRVRLVSHRQVVVASREDGAIIATWRDHSDEYRSWRPYDAGRVDPPVPGDPASYDELYERLRLAGVPLAPHRWGQHWHARTPDGGKVFLPTRPGPAHDVAADVAVLRRHRLLASQQKWS